MPAATKTWPPGFVSQLTPEPSASWKKAAAATKARDRRVAKGIQLWGTNTVEEKK